VAARLIASDLPCPINLLDPPADFRAGQGAPAEIIEAHGEGGNAARRDKDARSE